jgi:restriction endonuclease S subunit
MGCSTSRYRLGDLCEFYRGASVPRTRMHDSGDCLYIHYGDLYKGYSYNIDVEHPQKPIPFILNSETINDRQRLFDQDIVYVLTSETVDDLGHSFLFNNPQHLPAVAGMETTIVRVKDWNTLFPAYLNYLMHTPRFLKMLRQYVRGMKVFRVHPNDVARIEIELPAIETQQKVVSMLDVIHEKLLVNSRANGYLAA